MHAFIIEDEYLIGRSLQDMLEELGFTSSASPVRRMPLWSAQRAKALTLSLRTCVCFPGTEWLRFDPSAQSGTYR